MEKENAIYPEDEVALMEFLHGLKSGTGSQATWAVWYFVISALSIMILVGYRVNHVLLQKRKSLRKLTVPEFPPVAEKLKTAVQTLFQIRINLPRSSLLWEQAKNLMVKRETPMQRVKRLPSAETTFETGSTIEESRENSLVKLYEGTINGEKIRVRIFKEPTESPISEVQQEAESKQKRTEFLPDKVMDTLQKVPAEPVAADHQSTRITLSEE